jgi:undecaprenyl-diphosphatase
MFSTEHIVELQSYILSSEWGRDLLYACAEALPLVMGAVFVWWWYAHKRSHTATLILVACLVFISVYVLKHGISAPRPFVVDPRIVPLFVYKTHTSFPSGHAAFFAMLVALCYHYRAPMTLRVVSVLSLVLIASARVWSGAHFWGDVCIGGMIGYFVTWCSLHLQKWYDTSK